MLYYWTSGTVLTGLIMSLSMFYVTVEWCQQSFLSTEDYKDAMAGLHSIRTYRHWTFFMRWLSRECSRWTLDPMEKLAIIFGLIKKPQKTLLWTKHHTWDPDVPRATMQGTEAVSKQTNASPSIELTDFSHAAPHPGPLVQETPVMAHSLFPPAIPTRRSRNESDPRPRMSDDSSAPLIQRPSEAYHQRAEAEGRRSDEGRVSFEETWPPASPPDAAPVYGGWLGPEAMLQTRQGYRRANSEPGSPPGLGISNSDLEKGPS